MTGRRVDLQRDSWLSGLIGATSGIGPSFFDETAQAQRLKVVRGTGSRGLLTDFSALRSDSFDPASVHPAVAAFYERTSCYRMDAWAEWCGPFRPFGSMLAVLFSRRLQQLNVPLSALDTSRGITSDVLQLVDSESHDVRYTAWVRQLLGTGNVLYAGSYSLCNVPGYTGACVKVVFPLPNGNAMVIMRPVAHPDGSFSLVSSGAGFGDTGFYLTLHIENGTYARYVRSLKESIRVYPAENEDVRADHVLTLWGATFLRLHYRMQNEVCSDLSGSML